MQELTLSCRQCGSADMTRLDRKEYKCNHCGAVTIISDGDAERLEQLLQQMFAKQKQPLFTPYSTRARAIGFSIAGLVFVGAIFSFFVTTAHHGTAGVTSADTYFDHTTVPEDRVVVSPLAWVPEGQGHLQRHGLQPQRLRHLASCL
jgi:hypothetical protein